MCHDPARFPGDPVTLPILFVLALLAAVILVFFGIGYLFGRLFL